MDLDDSFTEKLIQKNRARKEYINEIRTESKKRTALVDEQEFISSLDEPSEYSPKRYCSEASQAVYSHHDKENYEIVEDSGTAFVPIHATSKARGLAALKKNSTKDEDQDMPCATSLEPQESANTSKYPKSPVKISNSKTQPDVRTNSYPADDEYSDDEDIDENDFNENYDQISSDHKDDKMDLDCSPIKSSKKIEAFNVQKCSIDENSVPVPNKLEPSTDNVLKKTKSNDTNVDPAELPLSARKALFEQALLGGTPKLNEEVIDHKLSVAQRAAMFENASKLNSGPKSSSKFREPKRIAIPNFNQASNNAVKSPVKSGIHGSPVKNAQPAPAKSPVKNTQPSAVNSPVKTSLFKTNSQEIRASPVKVSPSATLPSSPSKNIGSHTRMIQQKLLGSSGSSLQGREIAAKAVEERKQELSSLVNRWEKLSSSADNNSELERNYLTSEERVSYESDEQEEPSEFGEGSVSDEPVEEEYEEEENVQKGDSYNEEPKTSDVFEPIDAEIGSIKSEESDYNNEPNMWAVEDAQLPSSYPAKGAISSVSGSGFSSYSEGSSYSVSKSQSCDSDSSARSYSVTSSDIAQEVSSSKESKNPDIPLMHTVSFYRKQKQETRLAPVRTIVRRENVVSTEVSDTDHTQVIQEQIKALQEYVIRQQDIISQSSQALNHCSATAEFSGSTEQVEGERFLLIATQKRLASLNEIQRLKTCGAQGEYPGDGKGTLTISDIKLLLKREFVASQLEGKGDDTVHYFLCLIRHGAQVIVTEMMSTDKITDGALSFTNHIKLQNLPADFSVVFEVYAIQTKKEVLPHEKKYHIKREHSKIRLTPKGKKSDGKHFMPAISSPGGPNAVRSPSFGVVGYTRFTLQNCNKKAFTLDKVPFTSPLDGVLKVQLQLHADHEVVEKGFLTMFEDVSGFGAWHRRWCALDAHYLSYWKYPDDEHKKEPIGTIDLKQCVTGEVKLVPRDVCARPHTFQLVTVRPQAKGDKNTLISRSYNTLTSTKYLLSADIKEERILWCNKLNEALSNVRKWDPEALRPVEALQN